MIEIDGSHDEGGGQILRTAVGLSAFTGKAVSITGIRAKRSNPGMKHQHLEAVNAAARLCDAKVSGAAIGSTGITFEPGQIRAGHLSVKIPTAGSAALVLQALLIPAVRTTLKIVIEGGATYGKWAPPMDFMANVLFPLLRRMGYNIQVLRLKDGFYPKGGALVEIAVKKSELKPIELFAKGKLIAVKGVSVASSQLERSHVAERQATAARKELFFRFEDAPLKIDAFYRDSPCVGTGITLWAETEETIIGADALGEQGKSSESVGREAALRLVEEFENSTVDSHTADQLLPYLAIAGGGGFKTSRITGHIRTNAYIIEKFLDVKFEIDEKSAVVECRKI